VAEVSAVSAPKNRVILLLLFTLLLCGCARSGKTEKTVIVLRETPAAAPVESLTPAPVESAMPTASVCNDWYGWWRMYNTSGDWAHMYGYYWDCCAEIAQEEGTLRLQLWDEDLPKNVGLASARLREENGVWRCVAGAFLDRELGPDSWNIAAAVDSCGQLLHIRGSYDAVGKGGFQYEIFLRPWGSRWPGSEDEKPGFYESWYLPLVEAGVKMPEVIGKQDETNAR